MKPMKRIIHVDQFALNHKSGRFKIDHPPFVVLNEKGRILARGNDVTIAGPSRLVFSPTDHPIYSARAWIETDSRVRVK